MFIRTICLLILALSAPIPAAASSYVVRPGDSLAGIASRYHVSLAALARANNVRNVNLIRSGSILQIPGPRSVDTTRRLLYRVQWGDTLSGVAARYRTTVAVIRALNPSLGPYLLAGRWIVLRAGSSYSATVAGSSRAVGRHVVQVGETLSGIAATYGVSIGSLMTANGLSNPDLVRIGSVLAIPSSLGSGVGVYDPWTARSLIVQDAAIFGMGATLPLAVAWEESGFNQTLTSSTGAIGVMQVEPYTGAHISRILGRQLNLYAVSDNVYAGVYWLSVLLRYYGWNERLAVAAYYQGTRSLARVGMYADTRQYVANVMALKLRVSA